MNSLCSEYIHRKRRWIRCKGEGADATECTTESELIIIRRHWGITIWERNIWWTGEKKSTLKRNTVCICIRLTTERDCVDTRKFKEMNNQLSIYERMHHNTSTIWMNQASKDYFQPSPITLYLSLLVSITLHSIVEWQSLFVFNHFFNGSSGEYSVCKLWYPPKRWTFFIFIWLGTSSCKEQNGW